MKDEQINLTEENITLVVDGQTTEDSAFDCNGIKNRLSYTPEAKIKSGEHTVEITARDSQEFVKIRTWSFRVR